MVSYMVHSTLILATFWLLYRFFLRNFNHHIFIRVFLLVSLPIGFLAPLTRVEVSPGMAMFSVRAPLDEIAGPALPDETIDGLTVEQFDNNTGISFLNTLFIVIYVLVTFCFLVRFIYHLSLTLKNTIQSATTLDGMRLVLLEKDITPHVFFHCLFVNKTVYLEKGLSARVLRHEKAHAVQYHTLDVLLIELALVFFWFNPFVWLYKNAMVENHEYLADQAAITGDGMDRGDYIKELIISTTKDLSFLVTSGFGHVQLKNRITMLNQPKPGPVALVVRTVAVIVFTTALLASNTIVPEKAESPFVVVVDAGHGGSDDGAIVHQAVEKAINLQISQKLAALSDKKVRIITTRDADKTMTFEERKEFVRHHRADLFISLHCNINPENENSTGIEAYYIDEGRTSSRALEYCQAFSSERLGPLGEKGKVKTANLSILKGLDCPGILLELGFLTNNMERDLLTDDEQQGLIVKAIFDRLVKIRS